MVDLSQAETHTQYVCVGLKYLSTVIWGISSGVFSAITGWINFVSRLLCSSHPCRFFFQSTLTIIKSWLPWLVYLSCFFLVTKFTPTQFTNFSTKFCLLWLHLREQRRLCSSLWPEVLWDTAIQQGVRIGRDESGRRRKS